MSRVRTPTVLQMEAVECGAASLAIMLSHFGRWVPLEELRVACNVSRDGSDALSIVQAARRYGLQAKGFRYSIETLRGKKAPFIVFWQFRHFLVVEGFGKNHVYLNDPAIGARTVPNEEFDRGYTGLVLMLEPGSEFRPGGRRPGTLVQMLPRLATARDAVATLLVLALLLLIPALVVPTVSKVFVDSVLVKQAGDIVRPLIITIVALVCAQAGMRWVQEWTLLQIENKLSLTGSVRYLAHLLTLPIVFFGQRNAGDLVSRLQANDNVAQGLGGEIGRSFADLLSVFVFAAVMMMYDPLLATLGTTAVMLSSIGTIRAQRLLRDDSLKLALENAKVYGVTVQSLSVMDTVKASGGEDQTFGRWAGFQAKAINAAQSFGRLNNALAILPGIAASIGTAVVLGVGSWRIMDGAITVGGLIAMQSLMGGFTAPFDRLVQFFGQLQTAGADLTRVNDVLNYAQATEFARQAPPQRIAKTRLTGRIELRNVTFGYSRNKPPLVEGLTMTIEPGTRVALVGDSGSGKSTVAKLIVGLMPAWDGEILIDGVPIHDIPPQLRHASVGWVAQDVFLSRGTIYENLTLWDSTIPLEVVTRAAKDAEIHAMIANRPGGYDFVLEEGGSNVSGGEAQRLEIARTLAAEPTVLVLDEATSALDPTVEDRIDRNIRKRGITSLIVAHRLSTIRDADEIVVLDRGRVVERGTHEELMQSPGRYRSLVEF
jgi:NHLM bacteriocin system ABC transporter peptidase/ATP-binding protein